MHYKLRIGMSGNKKDGILKQCFINRHCTCTLKTNKIKRYNLTLCMQYENVVFKHDDITA